MPATMICYFLGVKPETPECPGGQVFKECGSACTTTCDTPENQMCTKQCVQKCECPTESPVWHEGQCITKAQCPQGNFSFYIVLHDNLLTFLSTDSSYRI